MFGLEPPLNQPPTVCLYAEGVVFDSSPTEASIRRTSATAVGFVVLHPEDKLPARINFLLLLS